MNNDNSNNDNMNNDNMNNDGGRRQNMNGNNNYNQMPPKKPFYKKVWFIVLAVIVVIIIITTASQGSDSDSSDNTAKDDNTSENATNNDEGSNEEAEPTVEVTVSAADLLADYDSNELNAEDTYKGKYVEVTGYFNGIDTTYTPTLKINGGDAFTLNDITLPLEEGTENYEYAKGLSEGDPITVRGTIKGYDGLFSIEFEDDVVIVQE